MAKCKMSSIGTSHQQGCRGGRREVGWSEGQAEIRLRLRT